MAIGCKNGSYFVYWNDKATKKRKEKYFGSGPVGKLKATQHNEKMGFGKYDKTDPNAMLFIQFFGEYLAHMR